MPGHGGIGAPYAHVTAPLRRLVDRFGTELCLAVTAGAELPEWLRAALPTLPEVMAASDAVAGKVTRACVDRTEAALLADRVGTELRRGGAAATATDGEPGEVYLPIRPCWPAAPGRAAGGAARVRLAEADPATGGSRSPHSRVRRVERRDDASRRDVPDGG